MNRVIFCFCLFGILHTCPLCESIAYVFSYIACVCAGYAGSDCSSCDAGWVNSTTGTCRKVADLRGVQRLASVFTPPTSSNTGDGNSGGNGGLSKKNVIIIVSTIGSAVLVGIISTIAYKVWQHAGNDMDLDDASIGKVSTSTFVFCFLCEEFFLYCNVVIHIIQVELIIHLWLVFHK